MYGAISSAANGDGSRSRRIDAKNGRVSRSSMPASRAVFANACTTRFAE
jgi:hypothetical protein